MASDSEGPEPLQYMMEVDNGMVHGLEYSPEKDEYSKEDLNSEEKSPEKLLEATENHDYDFEYTGFSSDSIPATKVGINATNGVIDVYRGEDQLESYSLVGVLENDEGRPELVFSGFDNIDTFSKSSEDIQWSPELAAAYEAVYNEMFDTPDKEEETVALYSEDSENSDSSGSGVSTLNEADARQVVKRIDDFIGSIGDPANGLEDFEENGEVTVQEQEHYGTAKGYSAAREMKTDLNRLESAGLMDYSTESLNNNGDEKEVDLKIENEFLDGKNSLRDDVNGLSDFEVSEHEGREELTEERM